MAAKHSKPSGNKSASQQKSSASAGQATPAPRPWEQISVDLRHRDPAFPNVPLPWLLRALALTFFAVAACSWLLFCFLFWQGSWQLLYHPLRTAPATPSSRNIPWQSIHFDASETGVTQLTAWWIPADNTIPHAAILVLHGSDGNLADTLPLDAWLHAQHQNVFAIDYRGYGQSASGKPSEAQLVHDATRAVRWLADTKHIPHGAIVLWGVGLGAEIAAQLAADSSDIGGVVLQNPLDHPLDSILNDPRSRLVPAHLLLRDHYDLAADAAHIAVPSLWLLPDSSPRPAAFHLAPASKTALWLKMPLEEDPHSSAALTRWLDELPQFAAAPTH